jgi:hypothetical protein
MNPSDLSGKLSALLATPRTLPLETALQAAQGMPNSPVASRLKRVDKLGESGLTRQAIDAPTPSVVGVPLEADAADLRTSETVLTHLSKTAGFLSSLLADQAREGRSRASLPAGQTVLDAPPQYPAPLALGLQALLETSGLFYESHLLSWYQGHYPRERLAQEPQSQWTARHAALAGPEATASEAGMSSANVDRGAGDIRLATLALSGEHAAGDASASTLPDDAARMITQQLLLLDKPSLACSVNLWPDQAANFLIEEESPRSAESPAAWRTRIQLDFPRLGRMDIDLALDGQGLRVHLEAENDAMVPPLLRQRAQCADRLGSTGCRLREFTIGSSDAGA